MGHLVHFSYSETYDHYFSTSELSTAIPGVRKFLGVTYRVDRRTSIISSLSELVFGTSNVEVAYHWSVDIHHSYHSEEVYRPSDCTSSRSTFKFRSSTRASKKKLNTRSTRSRLRKTPSISHSLSVNLEPDPFFVWSGWCTSTVSTLS
jgi:hypothetical protein